MAVLPVSVHAARWDLEDAMHAAGVDVALLDSYIEIRDRDHAAELDLVQDEAGRAFESGREVGYTTGYTDGRTDRKKAEAQVSRGGAST
jgi:hypothetical protein